MPTNYWRPSVEKRIVIKNTKKPALMTSGIDTRRVPTNFLILGMALIDRRGLMTLSILSAFSFKFP